MSFGWFWVGFGWATVVLSGVSVGCHARPRFRAGALNVEHVQGWIVENVWDGLYRRA